MLYIKQETLKAVIEAINIGDTEGSIEALINAFPETERNKLVDYQDLILRVTEICQINHNKILNKN